MPGCVNVYDSLFDDTDAGSAKSRNGTEWNGTNWGARQFLNC